MAFVMTRHDPTGGQSHVFPLFGIPFLLVGLNLAGGHVVLAALRRRFVWYTLTDRTAFVATRLFGKRRLDRYPLDATMRARLDDGDPGSVLFAGTGQQGTPWSANLGRRRYSSSSFPAGPAGFHRIAEARRVYGLLTQALANRMKAP